MQKKRLFVDMDGTIAEWRSDKTEKDTYQKGYFESLRPYENVLKALKIIKKQYSNIEIYILSAVQTDNCFALIEKNIWIDKHFPEVNGRLFLPTGEDKTSIVWDGVTLDDCLLDDYSLNLNNWAKKGTAIKLLNGVNSIGNWDKAYISKDTHPNDIVKKILEYINYPQAA